MKKNERNKREKALKKRTDRRHQRQIARSMEPASPVQHLRTARVYPLEGCWTYQNWREMGLVQVIVARRQPNRNLVFASYLVDLHCLGIKNALVKADIPASEFYQEFLPELLQGSVAEIPMALAHEIVYGAQEYASRFGFRSHRDFKKAQMLLDPPDAYPRSGQVSFGLNGKPCYVSGPYDNVDAILRQLERTAGAGNYDYVVQLGEPAADDRDEWDDDE